MKEEQRRIDAYQPNQNTGNKESPKVRGKAYTMSMMRPKEFTSSQGELSDHPSGTAASLSSQLKKELSVDTSTLHGSKSALESSKEPVKNDAVAMLQFMGIKNESIIKQAGSSEVLFDPSSPYLGAPQSQADRVKGAAATRTKTKTYSIEKKKANDIEKKKENDSLLVLPEAGNSSKKIVRGNTALALIGGIDNSEGS